MTLDSKFEYGCVKSNEELKGQLIRDLKNYIDHSKRTWFFYKPTFTVWAPPYQNEIFADDEFLALMNEAVSNKNRKFKFLFDKDIIEKHVLDNYNNKNIKDLPTLATDGLIEVREKWPGTNFTFKVKEGAFYDDPIIIGIGKTNEHVRSYMVAGLGGIFYFEGMAPDSIIEHVKRDKFYKRSIYVFETTRNLARIFHDEVPWAPPFEPDNYFNKSNNQI